MVAQTELIHQMLAHEPGLNSERIVLSCPALREDSARLAAPFRAYSSCSVGHKMKGARDGTDFRKHFKRKFNCR